MVCKEEVINWFRGQCGALRIETMCALLDCCLPYELRYVGTILENLGKRDFHELRDVENRANEFATHKNLEDNKLALYNLVTDSANLQNSNSGSPASVHLNQTAAHETTTSRPSPTHVVDPKYWNHWSCEGPSYQQVQSTPIHQKTKSLPSGAVSGSAAHMNGTSLGIPCVSNCKTCVLDESDNNDVLVPALSDLGVLSDDRKRHKLTLYFSLLRVTNRACSSSFYALLTQADQTVNNDNWLEARDENTLEELALLYTMGNNHPAFTFEQRTIVGDILNRIRAQLQRLKTPKGYVPQAYLAASGFDPTKYCHYYLPYVHQPHLQHQVQVPAPPGGVVGNLTSGPPPLSSVDISRLPPQLSYTFPSYSQYPVFMQQPHGQTHAPIIQNQALVKSMGSTLNPKPPNLQPSISLDSGWAPKRVGKEQSGLSTEPDQPTLQMSDPTISMGRIRKGCYNCGSQSHTGQECKESTIEEITKYFYRLNYNTGAETS